MKIFWRAKQDERLNAIRELMKEDKDYQLPHSAIKFAKTMQEILTNCENCENCDNYNKQQCSMA